MTTVTLPPKPTQFPWNLLPPTSFTPLMVPLLRPIRSSQHLLSQHFVMFIQLTGQLRCLLCRLPHLCLLIPVFYTFSCPVCEHLLLIIITIMILSLLSPISHVRVCIHVLLLLPFSRRFVLLSHLLFYFLFFRRRYVAGVYPRPHSVLLIN